MNATGHQLVGEALKQVWGYSEFRPFQKETIEAILEGRDSLTVLPTGGGKSLCFQLPASIIPGTAVVVSPLISLMADQVQALQLLGIPAAFLNSSLSGDEVRHTKAQLFRGDLKLLYLSPERLMLEHFKEELQQVRISFFAIDEAHCISQWGHDFRPEYKQLSVLRELFPRVGVHAFTATAPPQLQKEILKELGLRQPATFVGSYHRPNLTYRALRRLRLNHQLMQILKGFSKDDCGIIYCLTRRETEKIAQFLQQQGYQALPYHAGLDAEVRKRHQMLFSQEKMPVMVATVAFGMGIDQSNVRFVIHAGMPRSLSHYQQEAGRAGRDGLPSQCVLIHAPKDIRFWKRIIDEEDEAIAPTRLAQLQDMIRYATGLKCRHRALVEYFGQRFGNARCLTCDICLGEVESIAGARRMARMILSAVLKVRQRFGGAYVAQVLTGSKDQKILRNGHDLLSVYGLLSSHSQAQVHDWIDQIESQGYLRRQGREYPTLGVSSEGFWLLRPDKYGKLEEELPVYLVETRAPKGVRAAKAQDLTPYDHGLFEALRQKRKEIAADLGVPAFVVFGDKSLQDMARKKPTQEGAFLDVFGVGTAKLQKFGKPMLAVIRNYLEQAPAQDPSAAHPT